MKFQTTEIAGVYVIDLEPRVDERGYFSRVFGKDELKKIGIPYDIVQINRSLTKDAGMIRGLHYQNSPHAEDKIVQCLVGEIFDVALDIRKDSKTFGKWFSISLSQENMRMLIIPKGCAHGFQALKPNTVVEYFVTEYYTPQAESGIRWDDPAFAIKWPIPNPILSPKDSVWPDFQNL